MNSLDDNDLRRISPRTLLLASLTLIMFGWIKFALPDTALYAVDYLVRILCIGALAIYGGFRFSPPVGLNWPRTTALSVLAVSLHLVLFRFYRFFYEPIPILGETTFEFPPITDMWFYAFDLSAGLALVALSEELVFRFLFVKAFPESPMAQYALSCAAFGLFHAPQGLHLVFVTALSGLILMALHRATRTLAAPVAAHYAVDLLLFSGVLCPFDIGNCTLS